MTPALRFPEFDGDWPPLYLRDHVSTLDAGVSVNSGDRPAQPGEMGVLKTSCVTNGMFDPTENKVVWEQSEISRLREPVQANTIIISRMNTPALVGANALVAQNYDNLFLPDRLWAAKVKPSTSAYWLGLILADKRTRQKLSDLASGTSGTMKNISKGDVLALSLATPSLVEQSKIADFLGAVDERIKLLQRRRGEVRRYKKGMMQRIFLQSIRFKRADGSAFPDWEEMPFAKIAKRASEKFDPTTSVETPMTIELENIESGTGRITGHEALGDQLSLKGVFRNGDILFGKLRPYLNKFWLADSGGVCSSEIWVLRAEGAIAAFVFYLIQTKNFMQSANQSSGSKMPRADWSVVGAAKFFVPHPDEQQKIADFLSALDAKINAVTAQVEQMQAFKKSLLQQMFV